MKKVIVLLVVFLILETILLAISLFFSIGFPYKSFQDFFDSDESRFLVTKIERCTYLRTDSTFEYELPRRLSSSLRSYAYHLRLYLCLDKLPLNLIEQQYGSNTNNILKIYKIL